MSTEAQPREPSPGLQFATASRMLPQAEYTPIHANLQQLLRVPVSGQVPDYVPVTDVGRSKSFAQVVHERRSRRRLSPPSLTDVGTVLARCGLTRERATDPSGQTITRRPNPSAGALHPISLILLADNVTGIAPGEWVLDPDAAALRPGTHDAVAVRGALERIRLAARAPEPLPAAILAVAQPQRTLSKYPDGISLIWRDAGALLMLAHLAATDLGLGSCIVGTCGVLYPGEEHAEEPVDVGALIIGSQPPPEDEQP